MRKSRFPDSLVLIFGIVVLAHLSTYLLPAGEFEREGRTVLAGTYKVIEADPLPWHAFLTLIPKGLSKAADIIFFVFVIGGVIGVLRATGAIDGLIGGAIRRFEKKPLLLLAGMTTLFAVGSSTIGMAEEYMPFVPILVAMCIAMKFDAIVALGIVYIGAGLGYGCAVLNPFTVMIAKEIAGLPPNSGMLLRWGLLALLLPVAIHHLWRYASKIKADPSRSLVAGIDYSEGFELPKDTRLTSSHVLILSLLVAMIGVFIWGVQAHDWYLTELMALFLGLALVSGALARMSPNAIAQRFTAGAAEMTSTALLIGFARTIEVVLSEAHVIDTVVNGVAGSLDQLGTQGAALGMLGVQSVCNALIPSGSGQAYVTMPLMAPISDLTGVGRETAVLAYQFGDGFTNMLVPTNALLMGMLALGKIPYTAWLRFVLPLLIKIFLIASVVLLITAGS
ncbi:MAG: putative ion transporter superfamily protein YfcC [Planctomycetota bacterium]|jgi:uncharacterized ion transporter superfamily protein YfcC